MGIAATRRRALITRHQHPAVTAAVAGDRIPAAEATTRRAVVAVRTPAEGDHARAAAEAEGDRTLAVAADHIRAAVVVDRTHIAK